MTTQCRPNSTAAEQQIRQIIKDKLGLENLEPVLHDTAELRLELPGASLSIGEALSPPIKKPDSKGAKLKEIAEGWLRGKTNNINDLVC